ncbi:MAG: putative oxysterol binding family protein, partial [Streblomastix strix]
MSRADDAEDAEVDKILDSVDGAEAKLDDSMRVELNTLILETVSDDFLRTDRPSGHLTSDPILLKYQRSVIFHMLKTAGKTLFQGKSLVNISLPVRIFEARSYLQRITDAWGNQAELFKAAEAQDPVERLKHTATFNISGLRYCVLQAKPFNPILGETLQATYPGGINVQ